MSSCFVCDVIGAVSRFFSHCACLVGWLHIFLVCFKWNVQPFSFPLVCMMLKHIQ